jgi:formylglycine-generating enzyme required for sulfatase activity
MLNLLTGSSCYKLSVWIIIQLENFVQRRSIAKMKGDLSHLALSLAVALLLSACSDNEVEMKQQDCQSLSAEEVQLTGGTFNMGADPLLPEEGPPREVTVGSFAIDRTEVTNSQFAAFVDATNYVTLAERPLSAASYPQLTLEQRLPSSVVFDAQRGWRVVQGANWRHPFGPGSSIVGREDHPVVQVAQEDALAYARWAGRDLPTEAEWEFAARGGLDDARFTSGSSPEKSGRPHANYWQGVFPHADTGADGFAATSAPVGCFPPNGFGLHDMAGNVWEWTSDWYRPGIDQAPSSPSRESAYDPAEPDVAKHVIKGGSYLCADNYCFRYRPSARQAGPPDSGSSHVGFRTVRRSAVSLEPRR